MTAVRDAPSAAIEPLPRFLHLCYLGLAFFWACSMLTFRSSILLTGAADTPQYNTLIVVVSFLANMTVLLGVSALVERAPENLAKLSPWPFCGCILVGIAAIGGAGIWFAGPALSASLVIGSTLCGVGFGYLWGSWADVLGRVHPSRTGPVCPGVVLAHHHHLSRRRLPRGPHSLSAPCAHGSPANSLGSLPGSAAVPRAASRRSSSRPTEPSLSATWRLSPPSCRSSSPPSFSPACSALCGRPPCSA